MHKTIDVVIILGVALFLLIMLLIILSMSGYIRLAGVSVALLAALFFGVYALVKKKRVLGISTLAVSFLAITSLIIAFICGSGILVKTEAKGNSFTYICDGTYSQSSHSLYYIDNPGIIEEEEKLSYSFYSYKMRHGYRFRAVSSGKCDLVVWQINCAKITDVDVYHITVDEKLNCSYEYQTSEPIGGISFWDRTKAVRFNGEEITGDATKIMRNNLICLYGENKPCEEPSSDYPAMEVKAAIDWESPPHTDVREYYIKDENTYYYYIKQAEIDENGFVRDEKGRIAGTKIWYEFNKDPQCKNSLLDVWEMSK